jgi:hypothetical protein
LFTRAACATKDAAGHARPRARTRQPWRTTRGVRPGARRPGTARGARPGGRGGATEGARGRGQGGREGAAERRTGARPGGARDGVAEGVRGRGQGGRARVRPGGRGGTAEGRGGAGRTRPGEGMGVGDRRKKRNVAEPPELFQLKCLSHASRAATHLNRNNPSVPQI